MTSLNMIVSAAAPLGKDTTEGLKSRLKLDVKQAWGKWRSTIQVPMKTFAVISFMSMSLNSFRGKRNVGAIAVGYYEF
jgi:hypothetical protein